MRSTIHGHSHRIASLHEHSSRTDELAHKTFAGSQIADDTARCNSLERVLAVPRDKVTIVDDVFFAFAELISIEVSFGLYLLLTVPTLTSLRMIAPKLWIHRIPVPLNLCTNKPSPENMALLKLCAL
jgi:hypothetical protein